MPHDKTTKLTNNILANSTRYWLACLLVSNKDKISMTWKVVKVINVGNVGGEVVGRVLSFVVRGVLGESCTNIQFRSGRKIMMSDRSPDSRSKME